MKNNGIKDKEKAIFINLSTEISFSNNPNFIVD